MRHIATGLAALLAVGACATPDEQAQSAAVRWECPDGYEVKEGLNTTSRPTA
jgi:hypothetical protein